MFARLSLKSRIFLVNTVLLCITLIGATLMVWYTYKTENIFSQVIDRNIELYQAAEGLGTSLINQKGLLSYYILDADAQWIQELESYQAAFVQQLEKVKSLVDDPMEMAFLNRIATEYTTYNQDKERALTLYRAGKMDKAGELHKKVRGDFSYILELCDKFKLSHRDKISQTVEMSKVEASQLRYAALVCILVVVVLSLLINYILNHHILDPIRKLASQADGKDEEQPSRNEVAQLRQSVHGLIEDAQQTHQALRRSQKTLIQSEKMAMVGKLAAGTAHSIRNPLTSVKMRLFSLMRMGKFPKPQQEDLAVISHEIDHINNIIENFLEFSRAPRLKMVKMSPSDVVDKALHLLEQRIASYNVGVKVARETKLPETMLDPEQLKEVLVNIIVNACEAMENGGRITLQEFHKDLDYATQVVGIEITDTGPGIEQETLAHIFDPFFTTKDEGTGLGLSIAFNIIDEHGGWLEARQDRGRGACFAITLPVKES